MVSNGLCLLQSVLIDVDDLGGGGACFHFGHPIWFSKVFDDFRKCLIDYCDFAGPVHLQFGQLPMVFIGF